MGNGMVFVDGGADEFLKIRFNNDWPVDKNLTLELFVNDVATHVLQDPGQPFDPVTNPYIPIDTLVAGDLVVATGGGYAPKTLVCGNWSINPANNPSDAVYPVQLFVFTGPLVTNPTIYGYRVIDGNGVLQWAERLDAQFTPVSNGDQLSVTAKFQLSKGTPT